MDLILRINYFGVVDYIILGAIITISVLIGIYFGYIGNKTNEELLLGGRTMSIFPVAASAVVSYTSAITIIGFPSEIYTGGSEVFTMTIVSTLGMILSPFLFVPFFYPMKLTSVNEYLERRFQSKWVRRLASFTFIIQTILLNGVVLYAPSIALEVFLGFPKWFSIIGIGLCATVYTTVGGIKAVIWTDLFQFLIMVGGMMVIVCTGFSSAGGVSSALKLSYERDRMHFINWSFDPFSKHNFWNILFGIGIFAFFQPGINQVQVQRYSGMRSCRQAILALVLSPPLKLVMMTLTLLTGYALFAFYANCDPIASGKVTAADQLLPYFVTHETRHIPGMMGIFTSCIFCAVLSTLSSCLNSAAAVTWEDFLSEMTYFIKMSASRQANVPRVFGTIYGVILIILAFYVDQLGGVFTSSYALSMATAGVIYGLFIMAMFLPFVDGKGATGGGLIGVVAVLILRMLAFKYNVSTVTNLPTSTEGCPKSFNLTSLATAHDTISDSLPLPDWPWKIFSLSYLLYPYVGALLTLIFGILITFISSRGFSSFDYKDTLPNQNYVHPSVR